MDQSCSDRQEEPLTDELHSSKSTETASRPQQQPPHPGHNFKEIVQNAVEQENRNRARRAKSVVVSGLANRTNLTDKQNITQIISTEFRYDPNIAYCKRLGEPKQGYVRPLLVVLSSADEASWLVANAKLLRRSRDRDVSEFVFINANRTKEESRQAYEQRCRRRQAPTPGAATGETRRSSRSVAEAGNSSRRTSRVVENSARVAARPAAYSPSFDRHNHHAAPRSSPMPGGSVAARQQLVDDQLATAISQRRAAEHMDATDDVTLPAGAMPTKRIDSSAASATAAVVDQQAPSNVLSSSNSALFHLNARAPAFSITNSNTVTDEDGAGSCASRIDRR